MATTQLAVDTPYTPLWPRARVACVLALHRLRMVSLAHISMKRSEMIIA